MNRPVDNSGEPHKFKNDIESLKGLPPKLSVNAEELLKIVVGGLGKDKAQTPTAIRSISEPLTNEAEIKKVGEYIKELDGFLKMYMESETEKTIKFPLKVPDSFSEVDKKIFLEIARLGLSAIPVKMDKEHSLVTPQEVADLNKKVISHLIKNNSQHLNFDMSKFNNLFNIQDIEKLEKLLEPVVKSKVQSAPTTEEEIQEVLSKEKNAILEFGEQMKDSPIGLKITKIVEDGFKSNQENKKDKGFKI